MNMVFNTTFRGFYHYPGHENVFARRNNQSGVMRAAECRPYTGLSGLGIKKKGAILPCH